MAGSGELRHVYTTFIRTTPERLWRAITRFELVEKYYFGMGLKSELKAGSPIAYVRRKDGQCAIAGEVVRVVPNKLFVHTFTFTHRRDTPSRVTYRIAKAGRGVVQLTLIHDRFAGRTKTWKSVQGGWPWIVAALKSYLETGKPL